MSAPKTDLKILIRTVLWLLTAVVFYFIVRLEFLIWNWNSWYHNSNPTHLFEAFINGLRFDFSSLTWLSSVVLLSALIPWPSVNMNLKEKTLKCVFLLINLPFLFLNMIDLEFIHFTGRRMTVNSTYLLKESQGKLLVLFTSYWLIISINIFLLYLFYRIISKGFNFYQKTEPIFKMDLPSSIENTFKKWYFRIPVSLLMIILYIIFARGGLQPKPLEMAHALSMSSDQRLTNLALNSSFTTIHSLQKKTLRPLHYFSNMENSGNLLEPYLNANAPGKQISPWNRNPKNVVLIILESFGMEYTGLDHPKEFSFTPFLDSLKTKSLFFQNSYANGRRSIEALPSILAGFPSLMDEPFLTSSFQTNNLPQIGSQLAEKGINSLFFHGGANGTMFFQEFTQRLGFKHYIGKNEYPNIPKDDDGTWGIWDGPFFSFSSKELTKQTTPFLAVLFSLSSHHPFQVPKEYQNQLPKGPLPIHQSIAYTDLMLSQFFDEASHTEWYKDTLFIITADHTSKSYYEEYQSPTGSFRIPLLFYFPTAQFSKETILIDTLEPVQHIDIFPTLIDLFSLPHLNPYKLGRSLFKTGPRKVTLYLDGQQILLDKTQALIESTEGELTTLEQHPLAPFWKAHRQYFINTLLDNQY